MHTYMYVYSNSSGVREWKAVTIASVLLSVCCVDHGFECVTETDMTTLLRYYYNVCYIVHI